MSALIDTGVLLDYLAGLPAARDALDRHPDGCISVLSWVEIMAIAPASKDEATRDFLRRFERLTFNEAIADRAAVLARAHPTIPLSFAITYATARINTLKLITADAPAGLKEDSNIEVPYQR